MCIIYIYIYTYKVLQLWFGMVGLMQEATSWVPRGKRRKDENFGRRLDSLAMNYAVHMSSRAHAKSAVIYKI